MHDMKISQINLKKIQKILQILEKKTTKIKNPFKKKKIITKSNIFQSFITHNSLYLQ